MPIDLRDNVQNPGYAPKEYQAPAPREAYLGKYPVAMSDDFARVLALPRREQELDGTERAETIIDMETERYRYARVTPCMCHKIDENSWKSPEDCITRLRLVQAVALRELRICGGLLGCIGVGHGKTIVDVLAAWALAEHGVRKSVLLVTAGLAAQLKGDYQLIGQHFRVPRVVFHGKQTYQNVNCGEDPFVPVSPSAPIVHVLPYSLLKTPKYTDWLDRVYSPEAMISDECHHLRNVDPRNGSATAIRAARYMDNHPNTKFVGLSGSMTSKKLSEYDHLSKWALRGGSPLPLNREVTLDWGRAIDASRKPNVIDPGPLLKLCNPGESVRHGFRRRLAETLGVATTTTPAVDVTLSIVERPAPPLPDKVRLALDGDPGADDKRGIRAGRRPDGEELVDALTVARCAREAALGFYYKWIFPKNVFPRDKPLCDEWREARKEFFQELRKRLGDRDEHMDSPVLCQRAAQRFHGQAKRNKDLPEWNSRCWLRWDAVRKKVEPDTVAVFLDPYVALDCVAFGREAPGIIWYEHDAFGRWVGKLGGFPVYGGGARGEGLLDGNGRVLEDGKRTIVLSIKAHGTGRNGLQKIFRRQLIPTLPSVQACEQVLGRLHRIGQKHDVDTEFYRHTPELRSHVAETVAGALYVEGTMGAQQKIVVGFDVGGVGVEDEE